MADETQSSIGDMEVRYVRLHGETYREVYVGGIYIGKVKVESE